MGVDDAEPTVRASGAHGEHFDVIVIGAGFAGMYAVYRLRKSDLSVRALESGSGVGGTWYWNRYPGARVDVESMIYSYSFDDELQQEWHWPEHFSAQPDVERYANHVADRFDLRRDIQFDTYVSAAHFDDESNLWHIDTSRGNFTATYVVAATGSLNARYVPDFSGLDEYRGTWYHTADWPKEPVDFTGKRVGVIGTGSTGIQIVPVVAETAAQLYVFQRTANFSVPARNRAMDPAYERAYKDNYPMRRQMLMRTESAAVLRGIVDRSVLDVTDEEREQILEEAWRSRSGFGFLGAFKDIRSNLEANNLVAEFIRRKIRATVKDPAVAELLCPTSHPIGTKRVCVDIGYYESFNRSNVTLVDLRSTPIVGFSESGIRTSTYEYDLDIVVLATGFDAVTGNLMRMDITGRPGFELREEWAAGPRSYLGLGVAGFPNFFLIHGPGSPGVLAQMIMGAEWQVDWIAEAIEYLRDNGYGRIEPDPCAEVEWGAEVVQSVENSLFRLARESWYYGANIPGKPRVFAIYIGGFDRYTDRCTDVAQADYRGFILSRRPTARRDEVAHV